MTICNNEKDVSEVLPNLWLGNKNSALDINFINKFKIKHIVNVTVDTPNAFPFVQYLHIPINDLDTCDKDLLSLFDKATSFIYSALIKKEPVLVHCLRGHHRSASVVCAFMIRYLHVEYFDALTYINKIRQCAMRRKTCMVNALFSYYLHINNKPSK